MPTIRIELPLHLRRLANLPGHETTITLDAPFTIARALDALEAAYPMLQGTIRDHVTRKRRDFLRYFVDGEDWSFDHDDVPLPAAIAEAREPIVVLGAIAGG